MELVSKLRGHAKAKTYSSEAAFRQLFDATHLLVFRYVYGLLGGPRQEAEDITADIFFRAWYARDQFEGDQQDAVRWLLTIARNAVIDRLRAQRHNPEVAWLADVEFATPDLGPEEQLIERERWQELQSLVQSLNDQQREMLVLRYVLGWQVRQIAAHLGMAENTVSVNLRRIIQRLQTEVQKQNGEEHRT